MSTILSYPDLMKGLNIILASASPQRLDILKRMGFEHIDVVPSGFPENLDPDQYASHSAYAKAIALGKAKAVADKLSLDRDGDVIIAADTIVCSDGKIYGKPIDRADALKMLTTFGCMSELMEMLHHHDSRILELVEMLLRRVSAVK